MNIDNARLALEAASGGKNTIITDDLGLPSVMVRIPKFKTSDIIAGGPSETFPAFIVDGTEVDGVYISKYQNTVENGRAYSLAGRDPAVYTTFDQAKQYCEAKGAGWHLMSNAEWAMLAHFCKVSGIWPRGNNNYGADITKAHERGVVSYRYLDGQNTRDGRVLTGSGPAAWSHDGTPDGVFDLNGNVWEWVSGLREDNGEIQIIPNNDVVKYLDHSPTSPYWKAILASGALVAPGTVDSLKYDATGMAGAGAPKLNTTITSRSTDKTYCYTQFQTLAAQAGVTVPQILKTLALAPLDDDHGGDGIWSRNNGERFPLRGGNWSDAAAAGVFALDLNAPRSFSDNNVGFRSAFVKLPSA